MSAMMSWIDWMGLLDLFNTPYPNRPYGNRQEDFFSKLYEAMDDHDEKKFIWLCRHWILYHAGIQDADQGKKIWDTVNEYMDKWYKNKTGPDLYARFRKAIYGDCPHAGESYNNYQPCPPPKCGWPDKKWNDYYNKLRAKDWDFTCKVIDARNKLNDVKANDYMRVLAGERLGVDPCFLDRL